MSNIISTIEKIGCPQNLLEKKNFLERKFEEID